MTRKSSARVWRDLNGKVSGGLKPHVNTDRLILLGHFHGSEASLHKRLMEARRAEQRGRVATVPYRSRGINYIARGRAHG